MHQGTAEKMVGATRSLSRTLQCQRRQLKRMLKLGCRTCRAPVTVAAARDLDSGITFPQFSQISLDFLDFSLLEGVFSLRQNVSLTVISSLNVYQACLLTSLCAIELHKPFVLCILLLLLAIWQMLSQMKRFHYLE